MAESENPEEGEAAEQVAGIEPGGAIVSVPTVPPTADVVESQEKSGQTEKGEEIAAEVDSEKTTFEIGARVACLSTWDEMYHSAEVVDRREANAGFEYYVHYLEYNKRLDEWLTSTRVEKWRRDIVPPLKSAMAEKLSPLAIPASPALVGPGTADTQRDTPGTADRKLTRNLKRRYDEIHNVPKPMEELAPLDQSLEKEHEEKTKVKNIQVVELGKYEIDTWYYSPYPDEYSHEHKLYICEFCLKYMKKKKSIERHKLDSDTGNWKFFAEFDALCSEPYFACFSVNFQMKCDLKQPPGNEIYKTTVPFIEQVTNSEGTPVEDLPTTTGTEIVGQGRLQHLSMFEVDGRMSKMYCQNLCLLAKLFLDHKTLYYDVDSFLFYILTENDAFGSHLVGYFSKEKHSAEDYNLACILTLPPFQRKGYGRFLISFAYELSKKEGKVGTPERPLSDLGQVSFRSYWTRVILEILRDHQNVSIKDITTMTSIRYDDVVTTLQTLNLIKYWKGQHIISVTAKHIDEHLKSMSSQPNWSIDTSKLQWTPPPARRPK